MDINVNIGVNSQPLVEANKQLQQANQNAVSLNNTLSDKTGETQIKRNTNEILRGGRAMTGLRTAVTGFDKLVGTEIGGAAETVGALGQTFVGLGRALPLVTTAFRAMGAALMSNPIFLIGAAITGVVVAVGALMNSFGLLQPIIDGIGNLIQGLIDGFKSLTNWIGLTSQSMDDGKNSVSEYEKALKRLNVETASQIALAERDLEVAKAREQPAAVIIQLEEKLNRIRRDATEQLRKKAEGQYLKEISALASLTEGTKEYTEAEEKLNKTRDVLNESTNELVKLDGDLQVIRIEGQKKVVDERKRNAEKFIKIVEDQQKLEVLKTKEGSNEKINAQINELNAVFEARQKYAEDLKLTELDLKILDQERINAIIKLRAEQEKLNEVQINILKGFDFKNLVKETKDSTNELVQQGMLLGNNYGEMQQKLLNGYKEQTEVAKLRAEDENVQYNTRISNINSLFDLQEQTLAAQQALEITNAEETGANVELIKEKYRLLGVQNEQKRAEQIKQINKAIFDEGLETANQVINAFGAFSEFLFENRKKMLQEGTKEEEAAAKEQFEVRKRMAIASAVISAISGVVNILSAPTTLPDPIGAIYKGVQIAALAVTTAAQIGKISSQQYESTSASVGGGGSTPQTNQSSTPSFNLFGQGNQANVSSAQPTTTVSDPNGNVLRVIAEVSETEITAVQMRNRRYYNSAEL